MQTTRTQNSSSWMAILAATTLGLDGAVGASTVRASVRADLPGLAEDQTFRLVVQTYHARDGRPPRRGARPIGSMQRRVSVAELRAGANVSVLELRTEADEELPVVVAWIDDGEADLEFEGRLARPAGGSIYGSARRRGGSPVSISLTKKIAA
jgi:hypothetical protein